MVALFFSLHGESAGGFTSEAVTVKIDPANKEVPQGGTAQVEVLIEDVTNLGAFEFKLNYNKNVVTIAEVQFGAFLGSAPGRTAQALLPKIDNTNGVVLYGAYSHGANPGPNGNGVLARVTLTAQNIGVTQLDLNDVKVTDIDGNLMAPITLIDGQATVSDQTPPTPNAIQSVSAFSPTQLDVTSQEAADNTRPIFYQLDGQFFNGASWVDNGGGVDDYGYSTIRPNPFSNTGLLENGVYRYRQRVKDSAIPANESDWSAWFYRATRLNPPDGITFSNLSTTGMYVSVTIPPKPSGNGPPELPADQTAGYFDLITGAGQGTGALDRGWADDYTAEYTNLLPNTQYGWKAQYRNFEGEETLFNTFNTEEKRYTYIGAPTGLAFGAVTNSTLELQAQGTFPNLTSGDSGIYFDSTTPGGDGGLNEWIQSTSDTATGLLPNTEYTFQAKARNGDGVETNYGPSHSKYTLANTPPAPTVSNPTINTLDVDVLPNGNPNGTLFALYNKTADYYVNGGGGNNGNTPVWLTDGDWATVTVVNLAPDTTYEFQSKAKNEDGVETGLGPTGSGKTLEPPPDDLPPTPNSIQSVSVISPTQLDITSQEATDDTPPVSYQLDGWFFDGTSSSWINNGGGVSDYDYSTIRPNPFNDTGLLENGVYRYRQMVKDSATPANESGWSDWDYGITPLNPPDAITFTDFSTTGMNVSVAIPPKPSGNGPPELPADQTAAYFDLVTGAGQGSGAIDRGWADDYTAEYTNLLPNTQYGWMTKYRNYEGEETFFNTFNTEEKRYTYIGAPTDLAFDALTNSTL
jgi:hypothetical protein